MYFCGGIGVGTEVMCYTIDKKKQMTQQLETDGLKKNQMVALFKLYEDYELRFKPVWTAVKTLSRFNLRLTFEGGFEVVCTERQRFLMSNLEWKEAKELTSEDTFFQVARDPGAGEFEGDFSCDDGDFDMAYVPDDIQRIKLVSAEKLPTDKCLVLAVPLDSSRDNIVLANGAVVESVCLTDVSEEGQKL